MALLVARYHMATRAGTETGTRTDTGTATPAELRDPQRPLALLFGAVLVVLGVVDYGLGVADLGGSLMTGDRLLGVFEISPTLNVVHVLTGLLGLFLGRYHGAASLFNKLGGVIYLVVFLVGSLATLADVGGVNWATNGLHLLLAVVVGAVGFGVGASRPR